MTVQRLGLAILTFSIPAIGQDVVGEIPGYGSPNWISGRRVP